MGTSLLKRTLLFSSQWPAIATPWRSWMFAGPSRSCAPRSHPDRERPIQAPRRPSPVPNVSALRNGTVGRTRMAVIGRWLALRLRRRPGRFRRIDRCGWCVGVGFLSGRFVSTTSCSVARTWASIERSGRSRVSTARGLRPEESPPSDRQELPGAAGLRYAQEEAMETVDEQPCGLAPRGIVPRQMRRQDTTNMRTASARPPPAVSRLEKCPYSCARTAQAAAGRYFGPAPRIRRRSVRPRVAGEARLARTGDFGSRRHVHRVDGTRSDVRQHRPKGVRRAGSRSRSSETPGSSSFRRTDGLFKIDHAVTIVITKTTSMNLIGMCPTEPVRIPPPTTITRPEGASR